MQRITDFGAFVEIMPGTDGLLHVSEIANHRVKDVRDELKEGEQILVKVINIDPTGKIRLSRKALLQEEAASQPARQRSSDSPGSKPSGGAGSSYNQLAMTNLRGRLVVLVFALGAGCALGAGSGADGTARSRSPRAATAFDPPRIEVFQDDLVRIELHTATSPHSLTIDAYRIAKTVDARAAVTFEFRADRAGTFPFYCNLQVEDGCRQMRGELVVKPRR